MRKILFVDDDPILHKTLELGLKSDFLIVACTTLAEAKEHLAKCDDFVLAVIDRRLPDGDGLNLSTDIRRLPQYSSLPIIFLSGLSSESDRISGFFAGGDDYVTKPFSILELKARILARLRTSSSPLIRIGDLEIDRESHRAFANRGGTTEELHLTRIELKILITFAMKPGHLVARESLIMKIWGDETHVSDRVIDSHLSHLRRKISGARVSIVSIRGEGYRLDEEKKNSHAA